MMKRTKRILGMVLSLMIMFCVVPVLPVHAAGKVTIDVSATSVGVGDTLKVTARAVNDAGSKISADFTFNYDSSKFELVEGSQTGSGASVSITLKAIAAGSVSVSASGKNSELGDLTAGGVRITINEAGTETTGKSADNSLKSLKVSQGTLSPAFAYNVTKYKVDVPADVTSIEIDAKPSNAEAVIESITGNTDLKEGANTVSVVVKAGNGSTATYKITVNRAAAGEETGNEQQPEESTEPGNEGDTAAEGSEGSADTITLGGQEYTLSAAVPEDVIPEDFSKTTITCQGQQAEALQLPNGAVTLVYLKVAEEGTDDTLAVYREADGVFFPFRSVALENGYVILTDPPAEPGLPEGYVPSSADIRGFTGIPVYMPEEGGEFCLVYGVGKSGYTGWYSFDSTEGTLQRCMEEGILSGEEDTLTPSAEMKSLQNAYEKLDKKYVQEKDFTRKTMAILIFIIAVLLVLVVNLLLRSRRTDDVEDEEEEIMHEEPRKRKSFLEKMHLPDSDLDDEEEEEPEEEADQRHQVRSTGKQEMPERLTTASRERRESIQNTQKMEQERTKTRTKIKTDHPAEGQQEDEFEFIDLDDL